VSLGLIRSFGVQREKCPITFTLYYLFKSIIQSQYIVLEAAKIRLKSDNCDLTKSNYKTIGLFPLLD